MIRGTKLYSDKYGELTVTGKKHSPIGNKIVWLALDNRGKEHNLDGTEIPFEEHLEMKGKEMKGKENESKEKEFKSTVQSNVAKLAEKEFNVTVKNFPEPEKLSGLLTDLKKEIAGIETNINVENDLKPVADIVGKIQEWQKATVEAIRDIPEAETPNDYTKNFEALRSEIKAKKVDLLPIQKTLRTIADKDTTIDFSDVLEKLDKLDSVVEKLDNIKFEIPEKFIHKDNIKVSVDRVGAGAGGAGSATEAKQDTLIANQLSQMMTRIATNSGDASITYTGQAPIGSDSSGAVWKITRFDESVSEVAKFAGTGIYDQVWDDRESLSFS